jgi:D-sorbitol dehydrogenase (acceptor)
MRLIVDVTEASYDGMFAVNVKGLFFALQSVARWMIARRRGEEIIDTASQEGRRSEAVVSFYCASRVETQSRY